MWLGRVGGLGYFSLTGKERTRRGELGRNGIKAEKIKSQLMERCEFQVKDFRHYHVKYS